MKWFKHISDSAEDHVVHTLVDEFGHTGYAVFFCILELYAREFKPEKNWNFLIKFSRIKHKIRKISYKNIQKILKSIEKTAHWKVEYDGPDVIIFIPKFHDLLDNTTLRKLRSKDEVTSKQDLDIDLDLYKPPIVPLVKILKIYHKTLPELPQVRAFTEPIKKRLQARWKEDPTRQDLAWWENYFKQVAESAFLTGQNDKGWRADFDWLIGPQNMGKVLNGRFIEKRRTVDYWKGDE
jgi:hypothetical protein